MGVQGFPTLKIMTPSKKPGKPRVEDYQGARSAKGIVDAVVDHIPNHVKRATDKDLDKWLGQNEDRPKAILFTEKGTTSALIRALAIDFLGAIDFAQVRNKESASIKKFEVTSLPALVLVAGDAEPKIYQGDLKKKPITEFLSQAAAPNAPASSDSKPKPKPKAKSKSKPATKPTSVADDADDADDAESTTAQEADTKPVQAPISAPAIPTLSTPESLEAACLTPKSGTCVLAILPEASESDEALLAPATAALASLAEIGHKHAQRGTHLFPLYAIPASNPISHILRTALGLAKGSAVEVIALNARRGWWRRFGAADEDFGAVAIESWVDGIRLGEGAKEKLPEGIVSGAEAEAEPEVEAETAPEPEAEVEVEEQVEPEAEEKPEHDEL